MRGCSTNEDKRCEIGSVFEERKLDVLALSETKMKGKDESVFGAVKGRISGVMNGRAREGVGLLLSERVMRVCSGMEGSKFEINVGESKVWMRGVNVHKCVWTWK